MEKYDDIIDHPHYQSKKRKPMPMLNRAAQFAPFAALTGYDDAIKDATRQVDEQQSHDLEHVEDIY